MDDLNILNPVPPNPIPLVGRDDIIRLIRILINKKRMQNIILLGPAGVGKTAIVQHLASLNDLGHPIFSLSVGDILSNTSLRGELETKIQQQFRELERYPVKPIIFIDEIHLIMSAGDNSRGGINVASLLKPWLSSGNVIVIGATTIDEFSAISRDKAILRRFTPINIPPLPIGQQLKIAFEFGEHRIDKSIISYINSLCDGDLDATIDIVDSALAWYKFEGKSIKIDKSIVDTLFNLRKEFF